MLTQSEIDAITKEAEKFAMQYLPPEEKWKEHHEIKFNEMTHYYTAGATEERQRAKVLLKQEAIGFAKWYLGYKKKRMSEAPTKKGFAYWANKPIEEYYDDYIQTPIKKQAK